MPDTSTNDIVDDLIAAVDHMRNVGRLRGGSMDPRSQKCCPAHAIGVVAPTPERCWAARAALRDVVTKETSPNFAHPPNGIGGWNDRETKDDVIFEKMLSVASALAAAS